MPSDLPMPAIFPCILPHTPSCHYTRLIRCYLPPLPYTRYPYSYLYRYLSLFWYLYLYLYLLRVQVVQCCGRLCHGV